MANIKKLTFPYSQTGLTTVCIILKQMATGYFLDHVDGVYRAVPANPYIPLPELATPEQGTYERNENRSVWSDGLYRGLVYPDATGTKPPIGSEEMYIVSDMEVVIDATISSRTTLGAGAITWTYTLTDAGTGAPIDGAEIWITTDSAGANIIASGITDTYGIATFTLDAGTVYVWRKKAGFNFSPQPDQETVTP